ncbi:MAG: hypothetical protein ABSG95_09925 [Solirubrobacteraceae bacterium]|jgi:hypothetical protein
MAADLLSTVRSELDARLDELRPVLAEYERLLAADAALGAGDDGEAPPRAAESTSSTARRSRARGGGRRRAGAIEAVASSSSRRASGSSKRARARRGAAQQAILAALEHGSHTASELVSVTAMAGASIRTNLRRLLQEGTITQTKRAGRTAYALASGSSER